MEQFIKENWQWILTVLGAIMTGLFGLTKWFYNTQIKKPILENRELLKEQNQNYNTKFDETHKKIDKLDTRVLIVQEDTSSIKGSVDTILSIMKTERK